MSLTYITLIGSELSWKYHVNCSNVKQIVSALDFLSNEINFIMMYWLRAAVIVLMNEGRLRHLNTLMN